MGIFTKIATKSIDPKSALVFQAIGSVIVGLGVWVAFKDQIQWQTTGAFWRSQPVVRYVGVTVFFYRRQSRRVTAIVTMTALYPLISILLALVILKEPFGVKQGLGVLCALAALVLFSI
jgi:transporter family protein